MFKTEAVKHTMFHLTINFKEKNKRKMFNQLINFRLNNENYLRSVTRMNPATNKNALSFKLRLLANIDLHSKPILFLNKTFFKLFLNKILGNSSYMDNHQIKLGFVLQYVRHSIRYCFCILIRFKVIIFIFNDNTYRNFKFSS
ncbi:hypothetical protein BpHYR1_003889 [Brachionus plicatilis]|uniref:Uncharacterized protein n=1 Tax=Brachionus plicatilis TaxID=10195 RepID=A0A3M7Q796_BRAPC|nr:hypothetical protein BpHYR1_003889 [Brachionus plicatilis]